jgi:hypothetical protein
MRMLLVAVGMLVSAAAVGKPLPAGMKVITKLGRPYVQQGSVIVALRDDEVADYEKIVKTDLADSGKTLVVTAMRCKGTVANDVTRVPLTRIQARLDNAQGLVARSKKKYADAVAKFTSAAHKDPDAAAYATNLLSAQLLAKKLDAAGQTINVHGRNNPVWFVWHIAIDDELAAARTHKQLAALAAATPGTATLGKLGEHDLAITDGFGGIAALRTLSIGSPGTTEVDFVALSTGKLLARMPVTTLEDACDATTEHPCDDAAKVRIADRIRNVDAVLMRLGFAIQNGALVDVRNGDPLKRGDVTIETTDDAVTVTRGDDRRSMAVAGNVWAVAITPKAIIIKVNERNLYGCDDGSSRFSGMALPL